MLNFVCLNVDNYCNRGHEYVEILFNMVRRNLRLGTEGKFICFTNDTEPYSDGIEVRPLHGRLKGWWNKLYLFKDGLFENGTRVLYFDLDTVVVSGLDTIIQYDGNFAILRDAYRQQGLQSSIMFWKANTTHYIWERYLKTNFPVIPGGDQTWIENTVKGVDILQNIYPGCFRSYKVDCQDGVPKNTKVVFFHGHPKPHECTDWVSKIWKINGGSSLELEMLPNVDTQKMESNIRYALTTKHPVIDKLYANNQHRAMLLGGGPSLNDDVEQIKIRKKYGEKIFALNGTFNWCKKFGLTPDYHVIADARPENVGFVETPSPSTTYLIASHCDPAIFKKLENHKVLIWHRGHDGIQAIVDPDGTKHPAYFAGGSTVGLLAMSIAYCLGFHKQALFGYDSSYQDGNGHAYEQALNDGERVLDIELYDRKFKAAPWMVAQAEEFGQLAPHLVSLGVEIEVHGDGLIPHMSNMMEHNSETETKIIQKDGLWWPFGDLECRSSVLSFHDDIIHYVNMCKDFRTVVQAGGNVGVWPKELSRNFDNVYTFEPDNANFQCLTRNCTELNVVKFQAALGDNPGFIKLDTQRTNCGAHAVGGNGNIPILRIDDFHFENCGLIILDIEGFEYFALKGAEETIIRHHPVIVCEEKSLNLKYDIDDDMIGKFLASLGYKVADKRHRDVVYVYHERGD